VKKTPNQAAVHVQGILDAGVETRDAAFAFLKAKGFLQESQPCQISSWKRSLSIFLYKKK